MYRLHPGAMDRLEREIDALRERWEHHYGWPYLVDAPPARRPHRIDSAARRSRGPRPSWPWPERNAEEPWLDDTVEDEGDGDHRWVAEEAVPATIRSGSTELHPPERPGSACGRGVGIGIGPVGTGTSTNAM
ncbi:hypothetical protein GCM10025881_05700 [Pseudolysinimonas kribbensis]|uniref:Uncharacterized protein n=1 Tax=Pseudolysinimonas kribbensis TaxID=433641 RepID=A0ABQ6JZI5_9MICO|nr:hypothetical protein GCM10025881_05700 [Pseudolysinimonas kribbensis]